MKQGRLQSVWRWPFILVVCLSHLTAFAETQSHFRLNVSSGMDSNARRDFFQASTLPQADSLLSGIGAAEFLWKSERGSALGAYDIGARKFLNQASEDTLIQAAMLDGQFAAFQRLDLGLSSRARDRRGADRDYTDVAFRAFGAFLPDSRVHVRLEGGFHRFWFYPRPEYGFRAGEWAVTARYRFNARHSLSGFLDGGTRFYDSLNRANPTSERPIVPTARLDNVFSAGFGYHYKGPVIASLHYAYLEVISNSWGETLLRHRLTGTLGVRLPWKSSLLGTATIQVSTLPDGIFISQELNILEDDESHNSASAKWVLPLSSHIDLETRYSVFQNQLPQNGLFYLRHLGLVGLSIRT